MNQPSEADQVERLISNLTKLQREIINTPISPPVNQSQRVNRKWTSNSQKGSNTP